MFNLFLNEAHHLIFATALNKLHHIIRCQKERVEVVVGKEEEGEGKVKEEREVSYCNIPGSGSLSEMNLIYVCTTPRC